MLARTRGSALLILLLGIWGGIVPFVGGYFNYPSGEPTWHWSMVNATLSVAAGAVTVVGALLMMSGRPSSGRLGSMLALLGGAWFILGPIFLPLWSSATALKTTGSRWMQVLQQIGYHYGTGVLITALAGYALGAMTYLRSAPTMQRRTVVGPDVGVAA
jgi:hypothetical protein